MKNELMTTTDMTVETYQHIFNNSGSLFTQYSEEEVARSNELMPKSEAFWNSLPNDVKAVIDEWEDYEGYEDAYQAWTDEPRLSFIDPIGTNDRGERIKPMSNEALVIARYKTDLGNILFLLDKGYELDDIRAFYFEKTDVTWQADLDLLRKHKCIPECSDDKEILK